MRISCPSCHTEFPIEAGLLEADGKRLAAMLAVMEPMLGRAVVAYLRLFKPPKTALRTARAVKLVAELEALVQPGTVCQDERGGIRRTATPALWAAGIDQMLASPPSGLPLANHSYLRKIVFGLADQLDAAPSRAVDAPVSASRAARGPSPAGPAEAPLENALKFLRQQFDYGQIDQAAFDEQSEQARRKYGATA